MSGALGGQSMTKGVPLSVQVCFYCIGCVFGIIAMLKNEAIANLVLSGLYGNIMHCKCMVLQI